MDWKQRKLGEISEKVTEKNKDREFTETLTNSAEYGIVSQSDFFDKKISNSKNIDNYYIVQNNDFIYNPRISNFAPVGPIKRNKLNKIGIMSPLYYVFRTNNIDLTFLEKFFDTSYWHRFMKLNGDTGARADRFAIKDSIFKEMPIPCPNSEEQTKIGNLLKQIDSTIALHQRKLDKLQDLKKAALQSMFAQKDETEPKVRFTNFDEPWKHCNLGELVIIRSGFTGDAALNEGKYFLTHIETIASGEINFERVGYTNSKPDNKYLLTAGDILYSNINSLSQIGKVAQYQSRQPLYHGINLLRLSAKDVIDSRFLIQALRTNDKKVWAMSHANPAVNQASINQTELAKQTFVLPNKNEQREIGVFLSDLDDVITLYHKKLENLHELKKSFLQKMFI